ncbi:MAG: hypothetical protein AABZ39_19550 [Spirochaetota bacterium]
MIIRYLLLAILSTAFMVNAQNVAAAADTPTPVGVDLIPNGGFEDELTGNWRPNNWAKNEVDLTRDTSSPHSGKYAFRMEMKRITGASALELYHVLKLNPGDLIELRFWLRGGANIGPVDFSLRPVGPYRAFSQVSFAPIDDWTEHVVMFVVPEVAGTKEWGLYFNLPIVNTVYFDDVRVRRLPEKDGASARSGNLIKNGSFEAGRVHWSGDIRANAKGGYRADTLINDDSYDFTIDPDAAAGKRCWSFQNPDKAAFTLTSAYFQARYGHPVTLGFSVKTSVPSRFSVSLGSGKINIAWTVTNFSTAGGAWERKYFTVVPKPSASGSFILAFNFDAPGEYKLDNVTVVEGETDIADAQPALPGAGLIAADALHPGNVFYPGEKVAFDLMTMAGGELDIVTLDAWEKVVDTKTIPAKDMTRLVFPSTRQGGFKIEVREHGGPRLFSELLYCVVPRLKPASQVKDSFFGTHSLFSDYNLDLADKAGFRWLRPYPPHYTAWYLIEEKPGNWLWLTNRVAIAAARGFKILGLLNTTPVHQGDSDPGKQSTIWYSYPPKDWDAWRDYVTRAVTTFAPWIQDWEVWNEPEGQFLQVKKGENKDDVYARIVSESRAAISAMGANVKLLGPAGAGADDKNVEAFIKSGLLMNIDGYSHHWYAENISLDQVSYTGKPVIVSFPERLSAIKSYAGKPLELWQTEGGIYLYAGRSWMNSWDIPPSSMYGARDAANTLARTVVSGKAGGYKRNIFYKFHAKPTGRASYADSCSGLNDVDGTPSPAFAAHAVAVSFIEEATPDGYLYPDIAGIQKYGAFVGRFIKAGKRIDVLWSRTPTALKNFPAELWTSRAAFDMMGNSVAVGDTMTVDIDPVYFVEQ